MKKTLITIILLSLFVSLCACGKESGSAEIPSHKTTAGSEASTTPTSASAPVPETSAPTSSATTETTIDPVLEKYLILFDGVAYYQDMLVPIEYLIVTYDSVIKITAIEGAESTKSIALNEIAKLETKALVGINTVSFTDKIGEKIEIQLGDDDFSELLQVIKYIKEYNSSSTADTSAEETKVTEPETDQEITRTVIKDSSFRIVGYIEQDSAGNKTVKDSNFRVLGYYKKDTDTTTDVYGRIIAYGDMSGSLITVN